MNKANIVIPFMVKRKLFYESKSQETEFPFSNKKNVAPYYFYFDNVNENIRI